MLSRLSKRRDEEGFTLIELLVVIIIIGILAAIAIPVFLNQRANAWDAAVQADLRNAATAQETALTDGGLYVVGGSMDDYGFKYSGGENYASGTAAMSVSFFPTADATTTSATPSAYGFCLEAASNSGTTFSYSSPGGLSEAVCP